MLMWWHFCRNCCCCGCCCTAMLLLRLLYLSHKGLYVLNHADVINVPVPSMRKMSNESNLAGTKMHLQHSYCLADMCMCAHPHVYAQAYGSAHVCADLCPMHVPVGTRPPHALAFVHVCMRADACARMLRRSRIGTNAGFNP